MTDRTLDIGRGFRPPLDDMIVATTVVGKRGTGKTNTATRMAEQIFDQGIQTIVLDPVGVWYGLRSSSDGDAPGLPIVIIGGEHGDLPLEPTAGAVIADMAVHDEISMVLDISMFETEAEKRRFVETFLARLYRAKAPEQYHTPVHVVLEESEEFAPQQPMQGEQKMLGATTRLVKRGRARGLFPTLVAQRPASLNKNVMSQSDRLIAHRLTSPHDRRAIKDWIEANATDEQRTAFNAEIASLPQGTAFFWAPDRDEFVRVEVHHRSTFDSSATPKPGERKREAKTLAEVDMEALREQMAATIKEVEANDPKKLKAEIVRLKRELDQSQQQPAAPDNSAEIDQLRIDFGNVRAQMAEEAGCALAEVIAAVGLDLDDVQAGIDRQSDGLSVVRSRLASHVETAKKRHEQPASATIPRQPRGASAAIPQQQKPARTVLPQHNSSGEGIKLKKVERSILTVLAQYPGGLSRRKVAIHSGYTLAGGFNNGVSACRTAGWIDADRGDDLRITQAGLTALGDSWEPLPTGLALLAYWENHPQMMRPARLLLRTLYDDGHLRSMASNDLAEMLGYTPGTGGWNNGVSRARSLGLIEGLASELRLSDELMEALSR